MSRRRRPGSRTSVVDGRSEIVIPLEMIADADGKALTFRAVSKWFQRVDALSSPLPAADGGAALVLDRFAWDLHLGDVAHATDTHDGDTFFEAAASNGDVTIYVVDRLDPRRSKPEEFEAAARSGDLVGALVTAFLVDALQS